MKKLKYIIIVVLMMSFIISCDNGDPEEPTACLTAEIYEDVDGEMEYVETSEITLGETAYFTFCGESDYAVLYPGDTEHVYSESENDTINYGYPLSDDTRYEYTYEEAGTYTVVVVATNVSIYNASKTREYEKATAKIVITVSE